MLTDFTNYLRVFFLCVQRACWITDWSQAWVNRRGVSFLLEELIFRDTTPKRHQLPSPWPTPSAPLLPWIVVRSVQSLDLSKPAQPVQWVPQSSVQLSCRAGWTEGTECNCEPASQHHPQLSSLISHGTPAKPQLTVAAGLAGDIYSCTAMKSGGYVKLQHPSDGKWSPGPWGNGWRLVTARRNWSVGKNSPGITGLMFKFQLCCIVPFPPALQQQRHASSSGDQESFIKNLHTTVAAEALLKASSEKNAGFIKKLSYNFLSIWHWFQRGYLSQVALASSPRCLGQGEVEPGWVRARAPRAREEHQGKNNKMGTLPNLQLCWPIKKLKLVLLFDLILITT